MKKNRSILIDEMYMAAFDSIWKVIEKHNHQVEYFEVNRSIIQLLDRFNKFEEKDLIEKESNNFKQSCGK